MQASIEHFEGEKELPQIASKNDLRVDCLIVGGGMVGMSLGLALSASGISCAIIEAEDAASQKTDQFDSRSSAIAYGSRLFLEALDIWPNLADHAQPILDIRVSDGSWRAQGGTFAHVHYDYRDLNKAQGQEDQPPFGHIVENRIIRGALLSRMEKQSHLHHLAPARLANLEMQPGHVIGHLADGRRVEAHLAIGADGKNSLVRQNAGIRVNEFDYKQTAISCTIQHEYPHHHVAHERFLPSGPFAVLPMTDICTPKGETVHRSSIVWVDDPQLVPMLMQLEGEAFGIEIVRRFGASLGKILPLGKRFSFPLKLSLAQDYIRPRIALAGDAAHAIHPIAGQGYNLGIRDAAALADIVLDAKRLGLDPGNIMVLEEYGKKRLADNLLLTAITDGLNRLFSNDIAPIRLARDLGFYLFNRTPPLKRLAMRHAMGVESLLSGPLPRLMRPK